MAASLSGVFAYQAFTDSGVPAANYRLYTYVAGTTTHKNVFTEATGSTPQTYTSDGAGGQYIALNARGEVASPMYFTSGTYDLTLKTPAGATVDTYKASGTDDSATTLDAALRADLASTSDAAKGDALLGVKRSYSGAIARTQHGINEDTATIYDFLPAGFVTTNDATTYIQSALSSGLKTVDFLGLALKCDAVTVPTRVWAKNVNFTKFTAAAGSVVVVNAGCIVTGKITGTGTTSVVQRGIYPQAAACNDVSLLVEVSSLTYGVHAAPISAASSANNPKRWTGVIYAHDIVGTIGASEGYGVLLESAESCNLTVRAKDIRRHAVYLSAGASWNTIDSDTDACGNYAVQFNASGSQADCKHNHVIVRARNLTTDVAGQSGALAIVAKCHYNTCQVFCTGNATTLEAARIEGNAVGVQAEHPKGNRIINGAIDGQFTGADVVRMLNADGTVVSGNVIDAYGTVSVIAMRRTGTNLSLHGGWIEGNTINAQAQAIKGIYNEINTVPSYIGTNEIRNNSTAVRVDDQTSGKRIGYSRRVVFSGTTASIGATATGDTSALIGDAVSLTGRRQSVNLTGSSVDYLKQYVVLGLGGADETHAGFRVYNAHSAGQTFNYEGWVEGD